MLYTEGVAYFLLFHVFEMVGTSFNLPFLPTLTYSLSEECICKSKGTRITQKIFMMISNLQKPFDLYDL